MNNYQILGLKVNATQTEIKAAYKKLVMIHHPDRGGKAENFITLINAYEQLLKGITGEKNQAFNTYQQDPDFRVKNGEFQMLNGYFDEKGNFILNFEFTNVREIRGKGFLAMHYWGQFPRYTHKRGIVFDKQDLKKCDYLLKFSIKDYFGHYIDKEIKVPKPKISTSQKIINFIKELF